MRRFALVWILVVACTDRSAGSGTGTAADADDDSGDEGTSGPASTSSTSATSVGETAATEESTSDARPVLPIPQCLGHFTSEPADCSQGSNSTATSSWSSFACATCVCLELCETDADCTDYGALRLPSCIENLWDTKDHTKLCLFECESDADCPAEMFCLPSEHVEVKACYFAWLKPQCCDLGGPTC